MEKIFHYLLHMPYFKRFYMKWYKCLGVQFIGNDQKISLYCTILGHYENIILHSNAEINYNCFLIAKNKIEIGENSTLAYGTTIITSANPNGPKNKLSAIYPKMTAPVIIEDNVWIGANSTILPGVTIGRMSVVAAGSIVTRDVPSGVLVAGNPAVVKKKII